MLSPMSCPRVASPFKQQFTISSSAQMALDELCSDLVRKGVAVPDTSTFKIDSYSGWIQWEFTSCANHDGEVIKLALWSCLCTQISLDTFENIVRIEHIDKGSCRCLIPLFLLSTVGNRIKQKSYSTPEKSTPNCHIPTGFTPNHVWDKYAKLRTSEVRISEQKNTQVDYNRNLKKLAEIFRQLIVFSRENPNFQFVLVAGLDSNQVLCNSVLQTLKTEKEELWGNLVGQFFSMTNSNRGLFLTEQLNKNPMLQEDLFIVLLSKLNGNQVLLKQLVIPFLDSKAGSWGELSDVFGVAEEDATKNYLALCERCQSSSVWKDLLEEFKDNSEALFQLFNKLDNYRSAVIPLLYQCFLWGESERQGLGCAIQLFMGILGDSYQIVLSHSSKLNTKLSTFNLLITPPSGATESIVILLIQKLHSLLGADNFVTLITYETRSDGVCAITLAANPLESFQPKLSSLAALSFDEMKDKHIDVLIQRLCCGVLDQALSLLEASNPAKLSTSQTSLFIENFRKLVHIFVRFNEALVTDNHFRNMLKEKFGTKFNSEYVKQDPYRRLDALSIYLKNTNGAQDVVFALFNMLGSGGGDNEQEIPLVLVFEWLSEKVDTAENDLGQCFAVLANLWLNFSGYYEKHGQEVNVNVESVSQKSVQPAEDESHPFKATSTTQPTLPILQSPVADVPVDSPAVHIIRKKRQIVLQSPALWKMKTNAPYENSQKPQEPGELSDSIPRHGARVSVRQQNGIRGIPFNLDNADSLNLSDEET